ncbi:MAG: hybrid sensor histidine kinase/response regulator [Anaerolineae bacterium]
MTKSRIAIVDDMATARELLGALLAVEGYDLLYATNGEELLDNLPEMNPDVILLDVMMPGLDGFTVCQRLRAQEQWRHIPIILVTALDGQQDLVRGLEAGADDFLYKPVNGVELRARVRSMLRIKHQFDALSAALQLREDLANMVVHDMRSPLTAIVGFVELLRGGYISADDTEDIEKLHRQVMRLNALVNDILVQAKMEHGTLLLNREDTDISALVRAVLENHAVVAKSRGINVALHLPENSPPVSVDSNLFQRVVDNLLGNALKFSLSGATVTVIVEYPGSPALRLKVIDEGFGIKPEDRTRIFNKYEVAALRHDETPVGLGLAYCKLVVDAHGGTIYVEDNQPQGATFVVEI